MKWTPVGNVINCHLDDVARVRLEARHVVGRHLAAARAEREWHVILRILENIFKRYNLDLMKLNFALLLLFCF